MRVTLNNINEAIDRLRQYANEKTHTVGAIEELCEDLADFLENKNQFALRYKTDMEYMSSALTQISQTATKSIKTDKETVESLKEIRSIADKSVEFINKFCKAD